LESQDSGLPAEPHDQRLAAGKVALVLPIDEVANILCVEDADAPPINQSEQIDQVEVLAFEKLLA